VISNAHRELAEAQFDLLQMMFEEDGWTVFVSKKKNSKLLGQVVHEKNRVVVYALAHLGGAAGSMARTLLHEQIHAILGMSVKDEREEALVILIENGMFDAIDEKRINTLEYLLKNGGLKM